MWIEASVTFPPNYGYIFLSDIAVLHLLSLWMMLSISEANVAVVKLALILFFSFLCRKPLGS